MTKPVRSIGLRLPSSPGTRSRTHGSRSARSGSSTPSSAERSAATPATPPEDAITATPRIGRHRARGSWERSWAWSTRSSTSREVTTPAWRRTRSYTQLSSAMAPVCERRMSRDRSVLPSFRAMTALPAARARATASRNAPASRIFSITRQYGHPRRRIVGQERQVVRQVADGLVARGDRHPEPELPLPARGQARAPGGSHSARSPRTLPARSEMRPPVNRLAPVRRVEEAGAVRTHDRHLAARRRHEPGLSPAPPPPSSAKPPAATTTPPQPISAASDTTSIDRSALTSDSTASTGCPSAVSVGAVGRS